MATRRVVPAGHCARAFLSPGSAAVFSAHAFAVYPLVTQAIGARCNVVPAHNGGRGPKYGHDLDAMAESIDAQTRVVFIANPNNPTGTWLGDSELRCFVERVSRDVIVVIDEAYFEYVGEAGYPNAMTWVSEFPNLLVTRTFSKAYGLAGLRIGYHPRSRRQHSSSGLWQFPEPAPETS